MPDTNPSPTIPTMVVVSYDAASRVFSVNPNPVIIPPTQRTLFFALQTINKGDAEPARFTAIYEDNLIQSAQAVDGCDQLWRTVIDNDLSSKDASEKFNYTLRIVYNGTQRSHDPSVVLQPPTTDGY